MNEKEIRALGFEPWHGGDEAPGDWDGGEVIARDGSLYVPSFPKSSFPNPYLVIGYKKKETPMEYPEWVYVRAHTLAKDYNALCQHILDHEQPPVDPDLELAQKHRSLWGADDNLTIQDAILAAIKEARNA